MKVVLIDAFDSFIHTIGQYFAAVGAETAVIRTGARTAQRVLDLGPDLVVLGPGPGHPAKNEYVSLLKKDLPKSLPILGICLGHQAIGLAFGARVAKSPEVRHGKASLVQHNGFGLFSGVPSPLSCIRYHSLVVTDVPESAPLEVTARSLDDNQIMGLRHLARPIASVQFHPESIASEEGFALFRNALGHVAPARRQLA